MDVATLHCGIGLSEKANAKLWISSEWHMVTQRHPAGSSNNNDDYHFIIKHKEDPTCVNWEGIHSSSKRYFYYGD